jgi:hypothetical protein
VSKEITQERGEAVLNALVRNGIDAQRLKAAGLGLGPNRVEFIIESRATPRRYLVPVPGATSGHDASEMPPSDSAPSEAPPPTTGAPSEVPSDPAAPPVEETR